jgi:probable FeS assembly SUF system protein SufT
MSEEIEIVRDCAVTLIPSGITTTLHPGDRVQVMQALGGTVTVQTSRGQLARIKGPDALDLGLVESLDGPGFGPAAEGEFDLNQVVEQLKTVYDPEIPVNIVDLGLIYSCEAEPLPDGSHRVEIKMSMTAPGCGMGDILCDDARQRVAAMPGVGQVDVELIWDPPWELSRMSDAARLQLGML